jgi:AraC-like DNA-binding protein
MSGFHDATGKEQGPPKFFSRQVIEARRFYLDLKPSPRRPLSVVSGGCEECAPDYAIHRSTFPYHSIEFVAGGRRTVTLNGQNHPLARGAVFSYGPGTPHDITTDPHDPLVKYFVDFTGPRAGQLLRKYALAPGRAINVHAVGEIQEIFDLLIRNGVKATRYSSSLCATLVEHLILKIAESLVPVGYSETPAFETYQRCRRHIQADYLRLETLGQVARECHVTAPYLCRLFRRYDHQSPYQYILRLKMNLAAERLQHPAALVKQVADELGFSDPYHFSRTFKRVFGLSPEAFRRLR